MKDWKKIVEELDVDYTENTPDTGLVDTIYHINDAQMDYIVDQIISERDKEWEKWKALAEAMDNAPVGHRVIIKHLLGEDEWTLTRRNK